MGAKYDYCLAFDRPSSGLNWEELASTGFDSIWRRFGTPRTLSLQNYVQNTVLDVPYSPRDLLKMLPPGPNEIVVLYTRGYTPNTLLAFFWESPYLFVSASVEVSLLSDVSRAEIFEELEVSLAEFSPSVLVAGEELEETPELVERILGGESAPIRSLGAERVVDLRPDHG